MPFTVHVNLKPNIDLDNNNLTKYIIMILSELNTRCQTRKLLYLEENRYN